MIDRYEAGRFVWGPMLVFICGLMLAACGAISHHATFAPGFAAASGIQVRVADIIDAAPKDNRGEQKDFDISGELRKQLESKLQENGLKAPSGAAGDALVLYAKILEYDPGSAFGRWLMPGVGSTVLSVECKLYQSGSEVGTINALRTVSAGGFYTVGAWKSIFGTVAEDIVEELKKKIAPEV